MKYHSESGQILVLVLLVVLVALTIGLSIASRTLSGLKNTAELDQSNRAFSAAEAGIERALRVLNAGGSCDPAQGGEDCSAGISGVEARVTATSVGNSTNAFGVSTLDKDDVLQANLQGFTGSTLQLYWGNRGDIGRGCDQMAAAIVSVVYVDNSGNYGLGKVALDPCNTTRVANNFNRSNITNDPPFTNGGIVLQDGNREDNYGHRYALNLSSSGTLPLLAPNTTPVLARVRLMYAGPKPIAFDPGNFPLPAQGQQITSTASVGGKQRTVKVLKTTSALPAIFDYALFNGSTNALTK